MQERLQFVDQNSSILPRRVAVNYPETRCTPSLDL